MKSREKAILTTITILTVLFLTTNSLSIGKDRHSLSDRTHILIVDSGFLNCPLCLKSFTKFIEVINANGLEESFLGVLVLEREENELISEKNLQIIKKHLRGFISGNDIRFPFILDRDGVFKDIISDDIALILFDTREKIIKKYKFPLTKEQLNEFSEVKIK